MRSFVSLRTAVTPCAIRAFASGGTPIVLPPLPWDKQQLEPYISQETVNYHYGKHHAGYVTKLNANLPNNTLGIVPLIHDLKAKGDKKNFNLAAQIWNHTFYWDGMKPGGGNDATGAVAKEIEKTWGNFKTFKDEFTTNASTLFGSGWTWLVKDPKDNKLKIVGTSNAETPLTDGQIPLLTCDVWEHAYYIDARNDRAKYIEAWWKLVNWEFANKNLSSGAPKK